LPTVTAKCLFGKAADEGSAARQNAGPDELLNLLGRQNAAHALSKVIFRPA
jgi:hypothetical protein